MRNPPAFLLYVDDYEAATVHLSIEEDGAYMRLLRLQWRSPNCRLPNDHEWIRRRLRVSQDVYDSVIVRVLTEFFSSDGNYLFQQRLCDEYEKLLETKAQRTAAAKSRWDKEKDTCKSNAAPHSKCNASKPNQSNLNNKEESVEARVPRAAPKKGTRLPSDWTLPSEWRDWALSEGRDLDIDDQALRFRDYWVAKPGAAATKLDWLATWRNWIRNAKPGYGKGNEDGLDRAFRKIRGEVRNGNSGGEREAAAEVLPAKAIGGPGDIRPDDHLGVHALFRDDSHEGD